MNEFEKFLWQIIYLFMVAGMCTGIGFALGRGLNFVKEWIQERSNKTE